MKKRFVGIYTKWPDTTAFLLFALVAVLAYWQVSFLQYSLKWDMLDCYLPWRYFVAECWQNGEIPFWNPYQHFGYPIHADMRSAWNPESFLIGLAGGYSNITLHFLTIFYLIMAGLGMYKLTGFLTKQQQIGLIAGMAYILSGFFVGHGQDISFFISGAFVPWVLYYYLKFSASGGLLDTLKTALFLLIMVLAAYPAFTIFLIYILLIFFGYRIIQLFKDKQNGLAWKFIWLNMLLAFIVVGGSLVLILTFPQIAPYSGRFAGIVYQDFIINPFTPQSLISWLTPFVMSSNPAIFKSDLTMLNGYWGVLMMAFLAFAFKMKNRIGYVFLMVAILSLFLSLGPYTPVHPFFYRFVPGISLFRMPAIFILFTIIGLLVVASLGMKFLLENFDKEINKLRKAVLVMMAIMLAVLIVGLIYLPYQETVFYNVPGTIRTFFEKITFFEQLAFHGLLQLVFLSVFYFWLKKGGKEKFLFKVGLMVFIEMALAVQLNINYTGVNHFSPLKLREEMSTLPAGFPTPDNRPMRCHNEHASKMMPLWQNVSIYTKRPCYEGFNSFKLNQYDNLFDKHSKLANAQLNNPIVFLSDQVFPVSMLEQREKELLTGREIFIEDSLLQHIDLSQLQSSKGDTAWVRSFFPNRVVLSYSSQHAQLLTLMQSDYVGWQAYLDGEKVAHFTSNILFRSLIVPAGKHQVIYKYENDILRKAFYISYGIIFLLLIAVVILHYEKLRKQDRVKAITFLAFVKLALGIWVVLVIKNQMDISSDQKDEALLMGQAQQILSEEGDVFGIFNISNPEKWSMDNPRVVSVNLLDKPDLVAIYNMIDTCRADKILYLWHGHKQLPETEELIRLKYPGVQILKTKGNGQLLMFSKKAHDERATLSQQLENYEDDKGSKIPDIALTKSSLSSASNQAFVFSPILVWGPSLRYEIEKDTTWNGVKVVASCDIALLEDCDVVFSIHVYRGKKQLVWEGIELQDFIQHKNHWQKVVLAYQPKSNLKKGDEIIASFWNRGKTNFVMDDFELEVVK